MKKNNIKSIVKYIIKESLLSNVFHIILFGNKTEIAQVGQSFVKTGKGQLKTQVTFPSENSVSYSVWDEDVLKTMETILQGLGWKRRGVKGKDIIWTSPTWKANIKQPVKGTFGEGMVSKKGRTMKKSELKQFIKETLEEVTGDKISVGGIPVSVKVSGHQNRIDINIYGDFNDVKVPGGRKTNKGNLFYRTEAERVMAGLQKKFKLRYIKLVQPHSEYYVDDRGDHIAGTGEKLYWLVIEWPDANTLIEKLITKAIGKS